jgi:hypothetical protein
MTDAKPPKSEPAHPIARFCCGEPMTLLKIIPRVGSYPELQTYLCEQCHNRETIDVKLEDVQPRT